MTGLTAVAKKKAGGFSLGMGQRLGIANALLGDPQTLILDEPVNGLDPEGVQWVRNLARYLASQGKTIFISSHLMSEMAQTADHLIVIGRGKIIADTTVDALIESQSRKRTLVRTSETTRLSELLARDGVRVEQNERETLEIYGVEPIRIAELALDNRVLVYELTPLTSSLEEAYFQLTKDEVEYHSHITGGPAAPGGTLNGSPAGATSAATMEGIQS
jgi:ABC-2 type transport system ATP-binding protein